MWRYLRLARPHFLLGGAVLFAVGARTAGIENARHYVIGQVMVTAIQLSAQLVNEYADAGADALVVHRTLFSGGSGMISAGAVPRRAALVGGMATSAISFAAIAAMARISPAAAGAGVLALAVSWAYSMPPVRLLDTGWGETATSVVVAGLVPLVGAWSQGGGGGPSLVWSIAALVPLHVAMVTCFELPDLEADRASGKRVLAVRVGRAITHRVIAAAALLSATVLAAAAIFEGRPESRLAGLAGLALGATITAAGVRAERWSVVTSGAVASLVVVAVASIALG